MIAPARYNLTASGFPFTATALRFYVSASALLSASLVLIIISVFAFQSGPAIMASYESLLTTHWNPAQNQFGILPMLYGTCVVMMIAMVIALPLGVLSAIYISETRSDTIRRVLKSSLEVMAGIPSIVYGLLGVAYLSVWIANGLDLQTGRLILTAGLLLAIMILPTVISLTEDALSNIAREYRVNAYALGLYRHEVIFGTIVPMAKADIAGVALLSLGRAIGETMAVMLVIGSLDRLPSPIYNLLSSGQTLTSKLGRELGESAFGSTHFGVLVLMSLILVSVTLVLIVISQMLFRHEARHG